MLGEGFDFPELKIAALHDPHRSLGVDAPVHRSLRAESPDLGARPLSSRAQIPAMTNGFAPIRRSSEWDMVIERLAGDAIEDVRELDEFEGGFGEAKRRACPSTCCGRR